VTITAAVVEEQGGPFVLQELELGELRKEETCSRRGAFPIDWIMTTYDFDEIEQAVRDAQTGAVLEPVLQMT